MSKGYWIGQYVAVNRDGLARYGARFLVRWGQHAIGEGAGREHEIVVEFPDHAAALSCYHDPDYEAAHRLCIGAAVVEGHDGPQPPAVPARVRSCYVARRSPDD